MLALSFYKLIILTSLVIYFFNLNVVFYVYKMFCSYENEIKIEITISYIFGRVIRNLLAPLKISIAETRVQISNVTVARHSMTIL